MAVIKHCQSSTVLLNFCICFTLTSISVAWTNAGSTEGGEPQILVIVH